MEKTNPSGYLRVEKPHIVYSLAEKELWRLPIEKVRAIGEYTTANGSFLDDYFFVFVIDKADSWYEASFYADGRDSLFSELGNLLGDGIRPGLCNSTNWKTHVLWPKRLEGEELFIFIPEEKAKTLLGRLRQKIRPRGTLKLAQPVLEAVSQKRS